MLANRRLLVIDNAASYPAGCQRLVSEGCHVDRVRGTDIGVKRLLTQPYDVIIVREEPDDESWQDCQRIRHLSETPLIFISQNASAETCVRTIRAGADYFLRKPIGPLEFSARIESLLHRPAARPAVGVAS